MYPDAPTEFFRLLSNFEPGWVLAILVAMILAHRSPQLVRELFAGVRGLLNRRLKGYGRRPADHPRHKE
jgi:hypothetical protein